MIELTEINKANDAVTEYLDENYKGKWSRHNTTFASIVWNEGVVPPTESAFDTGVLGKRNEYDANAYARSRKAAYDALNQFELISDDAINGTTTHADAILAIKAEFPKP